MKKIGICSICDKEFTYINGFRVSNGQIACSELHAKMTEDVIKKPKSFEEIIGIIVIGLSELNRRDLKKVLEFVDSLVYVTPPKRELD